MAVRGAIKAALLAMRQPPPSTPAASLDSAVTDNDQARRDADDKRRTSIGALEFNAPHVVAWPKMPPEARAAAGAAALFAGWPLQTGEKEGQDWLFVRYDPHTRVVFVVQPAYYMDREVRPPRVCFIEGEPPKVAAHAVPATVEATLVTLRAAFGLAAEDDVKRFIKRRS